MRSTWRFTPPLLKTCRRIAYQATSIFYAVNTFSATIRDTSVEEITSWIQDTQPDHLRLVEHLIINFEPTSFADLLDICTVSKAKEISVQASALAVMLLDTLPDVAVEIRVPEMKHIRTDSLLLRFDEDDAEKIRRNWVEEFEKKVDEVREEQQRVKRVRREVCVVAEMEVLGIESAGDGGEAKGELEN